MRPTVEIATDHEGLRLRLEALHRLMNDAAVEGRYSRSAIEAGSDTAGKQAGYWIAKAGHHARNAAHYAFRARSEAYRIDYYTAPLRTS